MVLNLSFPGQNYTGFWKFSPEYIYSKSPPSNNRTGASRGTPIAHTAAPSAPRQGGNAPIPAAGASRCQFKFSLAVAAAAPANACFAAAVPGAAPRPRSRSCQTPAAATSQLLVCGQQEALATATVTFHALVCVGVAGARNSAGGKHYI